MWDDEFIAIYSNDSDICQFCLNDHLVYGYEFQTIILCLQDPNEDTEWNDVLRAKGILPPKEPEITEESIVKMLEQSIENKVNSKCNAPRSPPPPSVNFL